MVLCGQTQPQSPARCTHYSLVPGEGGGQKPHASLSVRQEPQILGERNGSSGASDPEYTQYTYLPVRAWFHPQLRLRAAGFFLMVILRERNRETKSGFRLVA